MSTFRKQSDKVNQLIKKAGTYTENGNPRLAIEKLDKIMNANSEIISADNYVAAGLYGSLGLAYYHLDKLEGKGTDELLVQAVKYFSKFLNIKEASENVLFMRAKCYDYLGMVQEAKSDYERVIELNPKADCAHAFLGLLMENEGHIERAKELYMTALLLDETDEMSADRLKALEEKGQIR